MQKILNKILKYLNDSINQGFNQREFIYTKLDVRIVCIYDVNFLQVICEGLEVI